MSSFATWFGVVVKTHGFQQEVVNTVGNKDRNQQIDNLRLQSHKGELRTSQKFNRETSEMWDPQKKAR